MKTLRKNKFVFYNLIALVFIKAIFSYSGFQFANLLDGVNIFGKEEVVLQTNFFRKALGLNELKESQALNLAASQKLQDMINNQYFAHTSPTGISPWYWIENNKYKYSYAGENLAIGFFSAKDTVDAWAGSPTHRANMANSNYKEIGIAIAPAKIQNNEGFLVVQLFGTPRPEATPVSSAVKPTPLTSSPAATIKPTVVTKTSPLFSPATTPIPLTVSASPEVHSGTNENAEKPTVVEVKNTNPELESLADKLNISLILYLLTAFLISAALLAFRGLKKDLILSAAANLAVLVLAVIIPLVKITQSALIL